VRVRPRARTPEIAGAMEPPVFSTFSGDNVVWQGNLAHLFGLKVADPL